MAHFSPLGMDGSLTVYRPQANLSASPQPDGWLKLYRPGDPVGVALDPLLAAVWSAADGHTVVQVAHATRISTYLAACALAVLQRAGLLLNGEAGTAQPVSLPSSLLPGSHPLSLSCFVIHHHAEADLESCLTSLAALDEITVLTTLPASAGNLSVRLIRCRAGALLPTLAGEVGRTAAGSVLILDSRFRVEPGCLDGLARTLAMRGSIGAVAPRVMWQLWPTFVVGIGLWPHNPYAGHLDVGQFGQRWQPVPAVSLAAGLFRRAALLQVGLPAGDDDLDRVGAEWCCRARQRGYRFLAAHQAMAWGPWPARAEGADRWTGRPPRRGRDGQPPGPGPMLHDGSPALTLDNVRGMYGHSPAIAPLPIRRRIALLAEELPHLQAMIRELEAVGQVYRFPPDADEEELLLAGCRAADLIIVGAEAFGHSEFLRDWPRPILLAAPPAGGSARPWSGLVDGILDMGDEGWMVLTPTEPFEPIGSLPEFCRQPRLDPQREIDLVLGPGALQEPPPPTPLHKLPAKAWQLLSRQGVRATVSEVGRYLRWRLAI